MFSEGGSIGVLNEDAEKFRRCLGETFFVILPKVTDER